MPDRWFTERTPQPICLVAAPPDAGLAREISEWLRRLHIPLRHHGDPEPHTPGHIAVVVVSDDAAEDPTWCDAIDAHADDRIIPVRSGIVHAARIPQTVRELNWIEWKSDDLPQSRSLLFAALNSDPARYHNNRSLMVEAQAWLAEGRKKDLLIGDRKRALSARLQLQDAAGDPLATPSRLVQEFVAASVSFTRRDRRRRSVRWLGRSLVLVVVVVITIGVVVTVRFAARNTRLSSLSTTSFLASQRPDWQGVLAGATLLQGDPGGRDVARRNLMDALSERWSAGTLGLNHDAGLMDLRLSHDRLHAISVDSRNSVESWSLRTDSVEWRRSLGDGRADRMDLSADDHTMAVGGGTTVRLVRLVPWQRQDTVVPHKVETLAVSGKGDLAVAGGPAGELTAVSGGRARPLPRHQRILDLRQTTSGDIRALVRDKDRLSLLDPLTGHVYASVHRAPPRFESGTIGPDGSSVAVNDAEREILYSSAHLVLHPTGQAAPDALEVLTLLPGRRIAFGGIQLGVRILDLDAGVVVGQVCRGLGSIQRLVSAPDGDMVACLNFTPAELWPTRSLSPVAAPPRDDLAGLTPVGHRGDVVVTGRTDGTLDVALSPPSAQPRRFRLNATRSAVTSVAVVGPRATIVAGSASGEVVQIEPVQAGFAIVAHWRTPVTAPVTKIAWNGASDGLTTESGGAWWMPPDCVGCSGDADLLGRLRSREWRCYPPKALRNITRSTRTFLGLTVCPASPRPVAG